MKNLIRELSLPNGLTVSFYDCTRHYFGDFYLVKMEIQCKVPVIPGYFEDRDAFDEARMLLGDAVVYKRTEEQMGVPSTEIERVLQRFITNFMEHSLSYFAADRFPEKLVRAELYKCAKKGVRTLCP
jgi:hypothetical protein